MRILADDWASYQSDLYDEQQRQAEAEQAARDRQAEQDAEQAQQELAQQLADLYQSQQQGQQAVSDFSAQTTQNMQPDPGSWGGNTVQQFYPQPYTPEPDYSNFSPPDLNPMPAFTPPAAPSIPDFTQSYRGVQYPVVGQAGGDWGTDVNFGAQATTPGALEPEPPVYEPPIPPIDMTQPEPEPNMNWLNQPTDTEQQPVIDATPTIPQPAPLPEPVPATPTPQPNPDLVPNQFASGLSTADAYAACGPAAAVAFARATGRNPTMQEAVEIARQVGWTPQGGMNGVQNQVRLLDQMGIANRLVPTATPTAIAQDAQNGNPVIISTPQHYFVVDGYNPQNGTYHVGNSGTAFRAGAPWMTMDQIRQIGGGINGTIFLDNPASPEPSVAVQAASVDETSPGETLTLNTPVGTDTGYKTDAEISNADLSSFDGGTTVGPDTRTRDEIAQDDYRHNIREGMTEAQAQEAYREFMRGPAVPTAESETGPEAAARFSARADAIINGPSRGQFEGVTAGGSINPPAPEPSFGDRIGGAIGNAAEALGNQRFPVTPLGMGGPNFSLNDINNTAGDIRRQAASEIASPIQALTTYPEQIGTEMGDYETQLRNAIRDYGENDPRTQALFDQVTAHSRALQAEPWGDVAARNPNLENVIGGTDLAMQAGAFALAPNIASGGRGLASALMDPQNLIGNAAFQGIGELAGGARALGGRAGIAAEHVTDQAADLLRQIRDPNTPVADLPGILQRHETMTNALREITAEAQVGGGEFPRPGGEGIHLPGEAGPAQDITDLRIPNAPEVAQRTALYGPNGERLFSIDMLSPSDGQKYLDSLPDDVEKFLPNLSRENWTPDMLGTAAKLIEDHTPEFEAALGKTKTLQSTFEKAAALGMTEDSFIARGFGDMSNEEATALRMVRDHALANATDMGKTIDFATATEAEKEAYRHVVDQAITLQIGERVESQEASRRLGIRRITLPESVPGYGSQARKVAQDAFDQAGERTKFADDLAAEVKAARAEGRPVDPTKALGPTQLDQEAVQAAQARVARSKNAEQQARAEAKKLMAQVERDWQRRLEAVDPGSRLNFNKAMSKDLVDAENGITDALLGKTKTDLGGDLGSYLKDMDKDWSDRFKAAVVQDERLKKAIPDGAKKITQADINRELAREHDRYDRVADTERKLAFKAQEAAREELVKAELKKASLSLTREQHMRSVLEKAGSGGPVTDEMLQAFSDISKSDDPVMVEKFLRGLKDFDAWNGIQTIRYNSMLSAIATHTNQLVSNLANLGFGSATKVLAGGIDAATVELAARRGVQMDRSRFAGEGLAHLQGSLAGVGAGWENAKTALKTGISPGDIRLDQPGKGFNSANFYLGPVRIGQPGKVSEAVDAFMEGPLRLMMAGDQFVRGMADMGEMRAIATRQAMHEARNPNDVIRAMHGNEAGLPTTVERRTQEILEHWNDYPFAKEARLNGARTVFQEKRAWVDKIVNATHTKILGTEPATLITPFVRTPLNILSQGIEASPAGIVPMAKYAHEAFDLYQQASRTASQEERLKLLADGLMKRGEMVDAAARATLGTAVAVTAGVLYEAGLITGPSSVNAKEPPGWQPWSVRLPDNTYVSLANFPPLAVAAVIGSSFQNVRDSGQLFNLGPGLARFLLDQTWIRGYADTSAAWTSGKEKLWSDYVESMARQGEPYGNAWKNTYTKAMGMAQRDPNGALEALAAEWPTKIQDIQPRMLPDHRTENTTDAAYGFPGAISPFKVTKAVAPWDQQRVDELDWLKANSPSRRR